MEISIERYEELIKTEQKANQYKKFMLDNSNNNQMAKALVIIEGKNLYQLIKESEEK